MEMVMGIVGGFLVVLVLVALFIVATDGRYFGKRLMYWLYDRLGPAIFRIYRESERWEKLVKALSLS